MKSFDRKLLAPVLIAFFAGILITGFALTRMQKPHAPVESMHDKLADGHGDEHGPAAFIKLSGEAIKTAGIETQPVTFRLSEEALSIPGVIEANPSHTAKITPPVAGRVVSIAVSLGDRVHRGQTLAVLQSSEVAQAHATVHEAESNYQDAQAAVKIARAVLYSAKVRQSNLQTASRRQQEFAKAGSFAQPSLQAARSELADAQAELLQAQTELQTHTQTVLRSEKLFASELISKADLEQVQLDHRKDQAAVEKAQSRVDITKQALEREQKVFSSGLLNRQALQTAEAEVKTAAADTQHAASSLSAALTNLRGAQSRLSAARDNLHALEGNGHVGDNGRIALKAPIDGIITERNATLGEAIERSTVAFEIENLKTVVVTAQVPEAQISLLRNGQSVTVKVEAFPKRMFTGVVQSIASKLDEKTRTLPVRCLVDNSAGMLKPEMFARIAMIRSESSPIIAVPAQSVVEDEGDWYVFVATPNGFERRMIVPGKSNSNHVQVVSGLKIGERVVTEGTLVLKSESNKEELKGHED